MKKRILLVEDNIDIQKFNAKMLTSNGFEVVTALSLAEAREMFLLCSPNIIVLDIGLPDGSGLDFLKELRGVSEVPVLLLTGFTENEDVIIGFQLGCDDYLAKPYNFDVLLARINRLLKSFQTIPDVITKGPITLNTTSMQAFLYSEDLLLSPKEFSLLQIFIKNENKEVSITELYFKVWGQELIADKRVIVNVISRLRKKITDSGYTINTIYNKGYIFEEV